MYILPLWLSFSSFVVTISAGRLIGSRGAAILTSILIFCCVMASMYIFYEICICHTICNIRLYDWISFDTVDVHFGLIFDPLSASMLLVITTISLCAHIYSTEYMCTDPHSVRFFSYLSLFTFFMLFLVLSSNYVQLFLGWEGVGICSYLLINFWYTRIQANKSSLLAVLVNKIGDLAFSIGCALVHHEYGGSDMSTVFCCLESIRDVANVVVGSVEYQHRFDAILMHDSIYLFDKVSYAAMSHVDSARTSAVLFGWMRDDVDTHVYMIKQYDTAICICFIIAAIGKSAQAGLHMWLPEAMEGPTPVSSLIHAATMVTAGIYLIVRSSFLFEQVDSVSTVSIFVGSLTAFTSATIGLLQTDIKKVIAYSTCSQLGYMFMSCGYSAYSNGMYHLVNHAFYKALLFLTAGYIIHAICNEQDIRRMGGLSQILPLPYTFLLIGSLSLIGFPFFSGFYSKDKLIEICFNYNASTLYNSSNYPYIIFGQSLCIFAVIFTLIYSIKTLAYVLFNTFSGFKRYIQNVHYASIAIVGPLLFLAVLSIVSGYVTSDMMVGVGSNFWSKSVPMNTFYGGSDIDTTRFVLHTEFNKYVKQITVWWTMYFTATMCLWLSCFKHFFLDTAIGSSRWLRALCNTIQSKYAIVRRLVYRIASYSLDFPYSTVYMLFDKGVVEFFGPFGIVHMFKTLTNTQRILQTGFVYHYAGFILLSLNCLSPILFYVVL